METKKHLKKLKQAWSTPYTIIPAVALSVATAYGAHEFLDDLPLPWLNDEHAVPINKQTEQFKRDTAIHEAAHTIAALALRQEHLKVKSVTIKPEGDYWGAMEFEPELIKMSTRQEEIFSNIIILYASATAEQQFLGASTTGVSNDISVASRLAVQYVKNGMSTNIPLDYNVLGENWALDPAAQQEYQQQVLSILSQSYNAAYTLTQLHKEAIAQITQAILDDPDYTLSAQEVKAIVNFDEDLGLPVPKADGRFHYPDNPLPYYINYKAPEIELAPSP